MFFQCHLFDYAMFCSLIFGVSVSQMRRKCYILISKDTNILKYETFQ